MQNFILVTNDNYTNQEEILRCNATNYNIRIVCYRKNNLRPFIMAFLA